MRCTYIRKINYQSTITCMLLKTRFYKIALNAVGSESDLQVILWIPQWKNFQLARL
jgi:hypothetical protein